jgi:hypothetical protein
VSGRASLLVLGLFGSACSLDRAPLSMDSRVEQAPIFDGAGTSGSGGAGAGGGGGAAGTAGAGSGGSGGPSDGGSGGASGGGGTAGSGGSAGGSGASGSGGAAGVTDCASNDDVDGDGYAASACGGEDCNDALAQVNPDGIDFCNGLDDDCSGGVDDGFTAFGCLLPSAVGVCVTGHCEIVSCADGSQDCDAVAANGCELVDSVRGDCKQQNCSGKVSEVSTDPPLDDGEECTIEECNGGAPLVRDAPDGTDCGEGGTCKDGSCESGD